MIALSNAPMPRKGRRQGFTLIEMILSMAIFSFILLAMLLLQYSTLQTNRVSTMQLHGTVALRGQMEASLANAYDNRDGFDSIAQGLVAYLYNLSKEPGVGAGKPVNVEMVNNAIVYTFPVSERGGSLYKSGSSTDVEPSTTAIGTLTVYLKEDAVPGDFHSWKTTFTDGTSSTNAIAGHFDMNANRNLNENFSNVFNVGEVAIAQSGLCSLPVRGEIRYYRSPADVASNLVAYQVVRNYIVNDSTVSSDDFIRDSSGSGSIEIE